MLTRALHATVNINRNVYVCARALIIYIYVIFNINLERKKIFF